MLIRFQWHIYKVALGVRVGPRFILTSPLNNTKRICKQKEVLSEKPIRKRIETKHFMEILRPLYFNHRNKKTNKMKVLRE